jgi:hypothetical protein
MLTIVTSAATAFPAKIEHGSFGRFSIWLRQYTTLFDFGSTTEVER